MFLSQEPSYPYERKFIEDWFGQCRARGLPCVSPVTGRSVDQYLNNDIALRKRLQAIPHGHVSGTPANIASVFLLREIDDILRPVKHIISKVSIPVLRIVALGTPGCGKSSILERLAMMPFFPVSPVGGRLPLNSFHIQ